MIVGTKSVFLDQVDVVGFVDLVYSPRYALFRNGLYRGGRSEL